MHTHAHTGRLKAEMPPGQIGAETQAHPCSQPGAFTKVLRVPFECLSAAWLIFTIKNLPCSSFFFFFFWPGFSVHLPAAVISFKPTALSCVD